MKHTVPRSYEAESLESHLTGIVEHRDPSFHPRFTFGSYGERWHDCPFNNADEARQYLLALQKFSPKFTQVPTAFGEGKARDLDAARLSAIWPEATDEELLAPKPELEAKLLARLPTLMQEFKAAVESLGFKY